MEQAAPDQTSILVLVVGPGLLVALAGLLIWWLKQKPPGPKS